LIFYVYLLRKSEKGLNVANSRSFSTDVRAEVPRLTAINLPVRINLLGGWSDQLLYPGRAAVINAAIGWKASDCFDGRYPLRIERRETDLTFLSVIEGIGTGLGISSIKAAAELLLENPHGDYVGKALEWEWAEGTKGGWQDQVGAIHPGLKLVVTSDHEHYQICRNDDHPILKRIVLFDTGIRRRAEKIGAKVRDLFEEKVFLDFMAELVEQTERALTLDADSFALTCLAAWKRFAGFVPEMEVEAIPSIPSELTHGHMMVGAGGGGFGIFFAKDNEKRDEIVQILNSHSIDGKAIWSVKPILLSGAQFIWDR
jgi:hypothetical protein